MSSRWSYGPDGLRERPVAPSPLLPRWRDLQPFFLRSAGVVGLVATIMAVVSSDALHFGGAEEPAALAAVEPFVPVVVPASELKAAPAVHAPEPSVPAPLAATSVAGPVRPAPEVAAAPQPDITDPAAAGEPELALEPVGVAAVDEAALEAPEPEAAPDPSATASAEQPGSPTSEIETTASVPAGGGNAVASLSPNADETPAAEISLAALRPSDTPAEAADADAFAWPDGATTCPRDWVEAEEGSRGDDAGAECTTTASLFTSVEEDEQAALEDAAAEEATVLASLPRIPLPRPEPPAGFEPSNPNKTVRVNSRNSSWPPEPPPDCAAGQRAKWRFVDRKAGTKEWYCK